MAQVDENQEELERVQKLLGVTLDDADLGRVEVYIVDAKQAIMAYIGQYVPRYIDFPEDLNYLVDQLVLAKYNKFHNEGMNSISEEGLTLSFNQNDLKDYLGDLQAWIDRQSNGTDMDGNAIGWC